VLDVPAVALHTGADVLGSESTPNLARASGLPAERVITVKGGEDFAFAGFSLRVLPSLHSALEHKHAFSANSTIAEGVTLPMRASEYLEGGTLAYLVRLGGKRILILSTANFIERELEGLDPVVAILATGLREELHDYECRLMRVLDRPPLVLTNHFDAWREPYVPRSRAQLDEQTRADLDRFEREIRRCAPDTRVLVPMHGEAITLP
jgi:L-ascorbate metabolism protein UlaG (beta-lactamase superfamily)